MIAPGGTDLRIVRGTDERLYAHVSPAQGGALSPSADILFTSMVDVLDAQSMVAVVLTGMGSDGTIGARALRSAGAAVLVEDPATALIQQADQAVYLAKEQGRNRVVSSAKMR